MKYIRIVMVIIFSVLLQACSSYIATTHEIIPYQKEQVLQAAKQVADNLSMKRTDGPLNAYIYSQSIFSNKTETVYQADLYLKKAGHPFLSKNNTETIGALKLTGYLSETDCISVFGSVGGDPLANSRLLIDLTQQQIELNLRTRLPFSNPQKSSVSFIALNLVSPLLGLNYSADGNPLISKSMLKNLYFGYGTPDAIMVGCLLTSLVVKNKETKTDLIGVGVSLGGLIRIFTMLNLIDLADYNDLARTDYNLSSIVK